MLLAGAGQAVFFARDVREEAAVGRAAGWFVARDDLEPNLMAAVALLHGQSSYPWYGDSKVLPYAPQYTALLVPLAALPLATAEVLARVASLVLVSAVIFGWARGPDGQVPTWALLLLFSLPVVNLLRLDQLMTAAGLAALSFGHMGPTPRPVVVVGAALAVGLSRTSNALPIVAMVAISGWGRPRSLLQATGAMAAVLVPLTAVTQLWDPNWIANYLHNLSTYDFGGPLRAARAVIGVPGLAVPEALACAAAAALAGRDRGRPLNLDRASVGLTVSVLAASLESYYLAVFALPALIRLGMRPGYSWVPLGRSSLSPG